MENKKKEIVDYLMSLSDHAIVEVLNANFDVDGFVDENKNLNLQIVGQNTKPVVIFDCDAGGHADLAWDERLGQFLAALLLLTSDEKINNFFDVINENTKPNN